MTEPRVTQEQLDLMRHTAGMVGWKKPYRNYFTADDGHSDWETLNELVEMGLMVKRNSPLSPGSIFHLTDQGCWMLGISGTDALEA